MKVRVDQAICTGCNLCADLSPHLFEMDDAGLAKERSDQVAPGQEGECRDTADTCPVSAIIVSE